MPVSSFHGLNTTLRGLLAHQRAIDTTGHNIANADTVGYSRQEATLGTTAGLTLPTGSANTGGQAMLGSGVDVDGYRRVRESFLDLQFRAQNMQLGEQSTMSRSLDQIELSLSEPSDNGMGTLLNTFWSSWGDVANNPESQAARQSVIDSASDVTSALGRLDAQLTLASGEAQADFNTLIAPNSEIDLASREIAQLNDQIKRAVASGAQPNDMLDRRDVLLDQLSGYAQLKVTDLGGGSIRVAFAQDAPLADVELVNDAAATFNANSATLTNPLSGKLGALNDVYRAGGVVAQYRAQLDGVASQLAGAVNAVHGAPAFFAGATAATIAVSVSSATLKTTATGTAGGNEIARAMSELRFAQPPAVAPDAAYRTLVSRIGTDVKEARRLEVNAQAMVNGVDQRRLSTSGVSLDEEMTNLVRFQRGYQASARAMNTFDEMLDQLINRTGRVGL